MFVTPEPSVPAKLFLYGMKTCGRGSLEKDWLNDDASDFSVARRVLSSNQPLEPEMWLTLASQRFPQFYFHGTLREINVPTPGVEAKPKYVQQYEESSWRRADMTLLAFLRITNEDGEVLRHICQKHERTLWHELEVAYEEEADKKSMLQDLRARYDKDKKEARRCKRTPRTLFQFLVEQEALQGFTLLEDFANAFVPNGEKAIAAMTNSRLNDKFYGQWLVLNCPFRALEDFHTLAPDVMEKVPERYRNFALCMHHAPGFWTDDAAIRGSMELEAVGKAMIDTVLAKVAAQRQIVRKYLAGELSPEDVVPSSVEGSPLPVPATERPSLTRSQKWLRRQLKKYLSVALRAAQATTDQELEECITAAAEHKMLFASGPPGTGKTFVVHQQIDEWKRKGARVLFAVPTGMLASTVRARQPDIDVDTTWGAFLFHKPLQEAAAILTQYDLVVVDEVSMLTALQFQRLVELWKYAEQLPAVVLLGDFWQLPVMDREAQRCELSPAWPTHVKSFEFHEQVRCKSPALQKKLNLLRTSIPSKSQLKHILKNHRAWKTAEPTAYDLQLLWRQHPQTTVVTCTRHGSSLVNELALQVFFRHRHKKSLGKAPLDYEANLENYSIEGSGLQLKKKDKLLPAITELYLGMRVFLTRNISKPDDFVNGMKAEVQAYDERSHCLELLTITGKRLAVHLVTEELPDGRKVTCLPVRLGYACTVPKVQGMTLDHITVWLDAGGCRAAAYVALSRVQDDKDYLIAGQVGTRHFIPAHD